MDPGTDFSPGPVVDVIAGPPAASPPLIIAVMLVALGIAGPFIFVKDGTPSLLLGVTAIMVALAGMITMAAAVRSHFRRRADAGMRRRVGISDSGIGFYPSRNVSDQVQFPWQDIVDVQVATACFTVHMGPAAPKPGRHAIRFGKLITSRADITAAIDRFTAQAGRPSL